MKYSEFKTEVEKLGYWVDNDKSPLYVDKSEGGETIIAIGKHKRFSVDPSWSGFHTIPEENQIAIYNLAHALTVTPLAEREEEKRYRLRLVVPPLLRTGHAKPSYFVISRIDGSPDTSYSQMEYEGFQKIFTESEIAKMDITGFQKVEVLDGE